MSALYVNIETINSFFIKIMLQNKNKIVVGIIVLAFFVGAVIVFGLKNKGENGYSVVYLTTGEIYVGKLTTFTGFKLTNSYILQVIKNATDPNKSDFQIQPISEALWATQTLHLVKENVVFYGALDPASKIAETLATQVK